MTCEACHALIGDQQFRVSLNSIHQLPDSLLPDSLLHFCSWSCTRDYAKEQLHILAYGWEKEQVQ